MARAVESLVLLLSLVIFAATEACACCPRMEPKHSVTANLEQLERLVRSGAQETMKVKFVVDMVPAKHRATPECASAIRHLLALHAQRNVHVTRTAQFVMATVAVYSKRIEHNVSATPGTQAKTVQRGSVVQRTHYLTAKQAGALVNQATLAAVQRS